MSQQYSDPNRADDPHALPDVEVFYMTGDEARRAMAGDDPDPDDFDITQYAGWYYWFCFPGCLPDSEPNGPYTTEAEAIAAAQESSE